MLGRKLYFGQYIKSGNKIGCAMDCAVIQTGGEKVRNESGKDEDILGKLHGVVFKGQSRLMIG